MYIQFLFNLQCTLEYKYNIIIIGVILGNIYSIKKIEPCFPTSFTYGTVAGTFSDITSGVNYYKGYNNNTSKIIVTQTYCLCTQMKSHSGKSGIKLSGVNVNYYKIICA